jgi:hypothetical protein
MEPVVDETRSMQARRGLWFLLLTLFLASPFVVRGIVSETPSICTFRNLFNIGCPGCGLTRSVCALSEGRVEASIEFHAFGPFVYALGFAAWIYYLVALIRSREPFKIETKHTVRVWLGLIVGMIGYWIVRLILGVVP